MPELNTDMFVFIWNVILYFDLNFTEIYSSDPTDDNPALVKTLLSTDQAVRYLIQYSVRQSNQLSLDEY